MCFGDSKVNDTKTTTSTPNPAVSAAATSNLDFATSLRDKGFQGYGGQQVADFSPQQQSSFDMTNNIANNGTAPSATSMINSYSGAPAQSVSSESIANNMSPYMNQYVMQALAPQMHQMDINNAAQNAQTNATATGSGAFGDARAGIQASNDAFGQNVAREGVVGNAYNSAFNTAIGAGAQDVSNKLAAQNANAGYNETALGRQLQGAGALEGLQNQQLGVAQAQNAMGGQQTAQSQAGLTALYNQWLMQQQYPFQTAGLVNQTVGAGASAMPASSTTTDAKPDNSGYGMVGSVLGTAASALPYMFSDARMKEDIDHVGFMLDDTPIYSYRYKADPSKRKQIGVMAQDEKVQRSGAVVKPWGEDGPMMVDYAKATELSRTLAHAL